MERYERPVVQHHSLNIEYAEHQPKKALRQAAWSQKKSLCSSASLLR